MQHEFSRRAGAALAYLTIVFLVLLGITLVGALFYYLGMPEPILSFALAFLIGVIVFSFGLKMISGFGVPLKDSCWASAIGHIYAVVAGAVLGLFFWDHQAVGLLVFVLTSVVIQSSVFRLLIRAKGGTLPAGKAYLLAVIMILSDFLISSPLVVLIISWVKPR